MAKKEKRKLNPLARCLTPEFRASYAHLFKPYQFDDSQKPKFMVTMLFDKKTDLTALKKAVTIAATDQWGPKGKWPKGLVLPFKNGDEVSDQEAYAGTIVVKANSNQRPGLVDQKKAPITEEDGSFYSGCFARATLQAAAWDFAGKKGVSFYLQNVQKLRDGDRFGGGRDAGEDFDEVEDDSENPQNYATDSEASDDAFSLD